MRIFIESKLQDVKLVIVALVDAQAVSSVLESLVVATEVESLLLAKECKAVHKYEVSVADVVLVEVLLWTEVVLWREVADGLDWVVVQLTSCVSCKELMVGWCLNVAN